MVFGAAVLLRLHIGGGLVGIVTGGIASVARKGQNLHRVVGRWFFASMMVAYIIATAVAPFLGNGQRPNFVAGILALYLLLSGASAARRRDFKASHRERLGLAASVFITAMGGWFAYTASQSPSGTVDGSPPQAFVVFIVLGIAGMAGEIRTLYAGTLSSIDRQKRHLWRMCGSLFIASGSLFLGQPQVFPAWFNESFLPALFSFAPLLVMVFWLIKLSRRQAIPVT
jgi:uncharacterized membrane protein